MDAWWVVVVCLPVIIGIIGVTALLRSPRDAQPDVLRALAEVVRAAFRPVPVIPSRPSRATSSIDSGLPPTAEAAERGMDGQ